MESLQGGTAKPPCAHVWQSNSSLTPKWKISSCFLSPATVKEANLRTLALKTSRKTASSFQSQVSVLYFLGQAWARHLKQKAPFFILRRRACFQTAIQSITSSSPLCSRCDSKMHRPQLLLQGNTRKTRAPVSSTGTTQTHTKNS